MASKKKSSWKTTLGGILMGVGAPLAGMGEGIYATIGTVMMAMGGVLVGVSARDSNVSSEDAGAIGK